MSREALEWVMRGAIDDGCILPIQVSGATRRRIGPGLVRAVLICLAEHAEHGTGVAWVGSATIAKEVRSNRWDVDKCVAVLIEAGYVELLSAGRGPGNPRRLRLMMPGLALQIELPLGRANAGANAGATSPSTRANGAQLLTSNFESSSSSSSESNAVAPAADDEEEFQKVLSMVAEHRRKVSPVPVTFAARWLATVRESVARSDGYQIREALQLGMDAEEIARKINTGAPLIVAKPAQLHPPDCVCGGFGFVLVDEAENCWDRCQSTPIAVTT